VKRSTFAAIDASQNRVREGLRTIEELVRYGSSVGTLTRSLRGLRHRLRRLEIPNLARYRGTDPFGGSFREGPRKSETDIVLAAAGRIKEAIRFLEEAAKLEKNTRALAYKKIRFEFYAIEKTLEDLFHELVRTPHGAYVLFGIDHSLSATEKFLRGHLRAGVTWFQLREKLLTGRRLFRAAERVQKIIASSGGRLVINDDPALAKMIGAAGVHLGVQDYPPEKVREISEDLIIGTSTHRLSRFEAAVRRGAGDYIAIGPVFETSGKTWPLVAARERKTIGRKYGERAVAIGGISISRYRILYKEGFRAFAGIRLFAGSGGAATARKISRRSI